MKIRQRLALRFTLISALLTGAILIFIYILTRGFVHTDFVARLNQQSSLEALHYATPQVREVMPPGSFLLVNPVTSIYSELGQLLYKKGDYPIPKTWINFLRENTIFNATRGEYTTVGRKYDLNGSRYLVFVSDKDLPGQHELDLLIKAILAGWFLSLVLSYLMGLHFSGNALQPMNSVVKEVNQITKDNLSYRLKTINDPNTPDEIDELILTFNALLTRIESAFISQKRFVQNASHELKTPLTAIFAEAELALARSRTQEEYKRTLQVIVVETERLVTITQGLLALARLEEGDQTSEMENIHVTTLVQKSLEAFQLHHPRRVVILTGDQGDVYVLGNAHLLQIALLNVLDNAAKYSTNDIILNMLVRSTDVSISIEDFGIGIPANELSRLRSPLFRGSNARNIPGAGLGLSLVDRITKVHRGKLEISSDEGKGTRCEITLPITL